MRYIAIPPLYSSEVLRAQERSQQSCGALVSTTDENLRPEVGRDILQRLEQIPEREPEAAKGDEDDGSEGAGGEEEISRRVKVQGEFGMEDVLAEHPLEDPGEGQSEPSDKVHAPCKCDSSGCRRSGPSARS